jgi:hypothetical protein
LVIPTSSGTLQAVPFRPVFSSNGSTRGFQKSRSMRHTAIVRICGMQYIDTVLIPSSLDPTVWDTPGASDIRRPARQQLPDAALTRGAQRATRSRCPRRCGRYQTCHLQGNSGVSISQLSALRGIPSAATNSTEICEATLRLRGATRSPIRLAAQKTPRGIVAP